MSKSILIIDDSVAVLKILQIQIEATDFGCPIHMEYLSNPLHAIPLIKELLALGIETVLIVVDFKMPELNGYELIKRVKKIYPKIKFIMLSGQASETLVKELIESKDLEAYIPKPWDMQVLMNKIKTLI